MAYITLEDDSGTMELVAFQRVLDQGGGYVRNNACILVSGRITLRDEKEPQITVDTIQPISELDSIPAQESHRQKKLYVRLNSDEEKKLRRIELLLEMFIGKDTMVLYLADLKKQRTASCLIHPALVQELKEQIGSENVVVK